jgi:hypothetical protein
MKYKKIGIEKEAVVLLWQKLYLPKLCIGMQNYISAQEIGSKGLVERRRLTLRTKQKKRLREL